MPQFHSISELMAYVQEAIDDALTNEVFEIVKDTEVEVIDETVYSQPTSGTYRRRHSGGGLGDPSNIVIDGGAASKGVLAVSNETPANPFLNGVDGAKSSTPSGSHIARLVEEGISNSGGYGYDYWDGKARPFTANTVDKLQGSGEIKDALRSGLARQGIKTR